MPELRLKSILEGHSEKHGGIAALAREIKSANQGRREVSERKLAAILSGEANVLRVAELEALSTYLTPFGQGLADMPLFDADGILRDLVAKEEVVFFAATRSRKNRDYTSVWDVRAFNDVVGSINYRWPTTRISLMEEVERFAEDAPSEQHWPQLLADVDGDRSYCCLGGPRAFGLTEYMLATMFGVPPFKKGVPAGPPLPFYFVWHPHPDKSKTQSVQSQFALAASDLPDTEFKLPNEDLPNLIEDRKAQAFLARHDLKVYPVYLDRGEWEEYGVIVAQRRERGEIWVVVGGLSGPGTYAAAKMLNEISLPVPESKPGEVSPPVYAVVEAAVKVKADKTSGDVRDVMGQKIVVGPQVWDH